MSTCGNCDCADKSQCVKKGNSYGVEIIETEKSYHDGVFEVAAAKNEGNCKCGPSCACVDCHCGN
uniref:Metallothionein type 3 n=1 Tax=Typha angustifolia TaxID=59011 RepID=C9DSL6_TYPAN|nr:metallothionein type 3 [Typha angustifolia]